MNEPLRTTSRPVILMRPGEANNRLAEPVSYTHLTLPTTVIV